MQISDYKKTLQRLRAADYKKYYKRLGRPGRIALAMLGVLIVGSIFFTSLFGKKQQAAGQPQQPPAVPVTVASVALENVPVQVNAIGRTEAYSTVAITSQAEGQITRVNFTEGQFVKKGDLLFNIDPRPVQANLAGAVANQARAVNEQRQAQATLAKDRAQAQTAAVQAQRYEYLYKQGVVSKEQYEQVRTNAEALAAVAKADEAAVASARDAVKASQAAVQSSQVQASFTEIRAPIDGRTGSLMIHQGNVVSPNAQNPLVVINQVTPIYVTFSVPETQLPDIKRYLAAGPVQVSGVIPNDAGPPELGTLSFVDNAVDPATGTVKLKATFENAQQRLWPGQFVNVSVTLTTQPNAIVVPSTAVQTGQQGRYAFVVKDDQTVELRNVQVQRTAGDKTIIASGLAAGETVVTDGQLRLRPGSRIRVSESAGQTGPGQDNP
ncbi:MAG TPA: efflux RND transporter periplasmic adaptor subunit [Blastocatellia bacterium]|nr:efflux RND transporter periplasmic adaptor subunit [Blastocatellia bacterium]